MTYELAKKLKEAGFPMESTGFGEFCIHDLPDGMCDKECDYVVSFPSLEELIEACGDYFVDIQRLAENDWKAGGGTVVDGKIGYNCEVRAQSPSEAVANLWLALNENKK